MTAANFLKELYEFPLDLMNSKHSWDVLLYDYIRDRVRYRSGIRFKGVAATRWRAERCCTVWHIDAYDTLVEVENSDWAKEIRADTDERWRDRWQMHHYMFYLKDDGAFEFIADSWEILPEEKGTWPETSTA
jgi:hypothetical protein